MEDVVVLGFAVCVLIRNRGHGYEGAVFVLEELDAVNREIADGHACHRAKTLARIIKGLVDVDLVCGLFLLLLTSGSRAAFLSCCHGCPPFFLRYLYKKPEAASRHPA